MLWKLGIFFIAIGIAKLVYYIVAERRNTNDNRRG